MQLNVVLAFIVAFVIAVMVFWKFLRASGLIPGFFGEWKQRHVIRGTLELSWNSVPPLWQRILVALCMVAMLVIVVIGSVQRGIHAPGGMWGPLFLMIWGMLMLGSMELFPRHYHITDQGIWCTMARIFGDPENDRYTPKRLVWWKDVEAFDVRQGKIIFHLRFSEQQETYSLPLWMLIKTLKKVEVTFSKTDPDLESRIVACIHRHCPGAIQYKLGLRI